VGLVLLVAMETQVRQDLKDLDASAYLWTTSEVDRHIAHAVNDYQRVLPLVASMVIVVASSASQGPSSPITVRQVLTPPAGYLWTVRVEYPIDQEPPAYLVFREEVADKGSLYFPAAQAPRVGDNMGIWYAKTHTLSNAASTILTEHEELIGLGAVAYAASAGTRYATGRLNASMWTPKGLSAFAADRMAAYKAWLSRVEADYATAGVPMPQWGSFPSDWNQV
jgi:hypothetical protein